MPAFKRFRESTLVRVAGSPLLTMALLGWTMVLLNWGTFSQVNAGTWVARERFFSAWWFNGPLGIPLPGMRMIILVGVIHLLAVLPRFFNTRNPRGRHRIYLHIALLVFLVGILATSGTRSEFRLVLTDGESTTTAGSPSRWELLVQEMVGSGNPERIALRGMENRINEVFDAAGLSVRVKRFFPNSISLAGASPPYRLRRVPSSPSPSKNIPGISLECSLSDQDAIRKVIVYGGSSEPLVLSFGKRKWHIRLQRVQLRLPFRLTLESFRIDYYPGSRIPRGYTSQVRITAPFRESVAQIRLNRPLRHAGLSIYQVSHIQDPRGGHAYSVLAVVRDSGSWVPIATIPLIIITLSLLFIHPGKRKEPHPENSMNGIKITLVILILMVQSPLSGAGGNADSFTARFSAVPIQSRGRIQPMDTFARRTLFQLSGRKSVRGYSAMQWLTRVLFQPRSASAIPVIRVRLESTAKALDLPMGIGKKERLYSLDDLLPRAEQLGAFARNALRVPRSERSPAQSEWVRLYNNTRALNQLLLSFRFNEPHRDFIVSDPHIKRLLSLPDEVHPLSFFTLFSALSEAGYPDTENTRPLSRNARKSLDGIWRALNAWTRAYENHPMRILPPRRGATEWRSPWSLFATTLRKKERIPRPLRRMATLNSDHTFPETFLDELNRRVRDNPPAGLSNFRLWIELYSNRTHPLRLALIFYLLSLAVNLLCSLSGKPLLAAISKLLVIAGFTVHGGSILARMIVLSRIPLSGLADTFIFTSWAAAALSLFMPRSGNRRIRAWSAAFSAALLLTAAFHFGSGSETMGVVTAILNSRLWLTIHVLTIALGFSGFLLSGLFGHALIIRKILSPGSPAPEGFRTLYRFHAFGLFFTILGTYLGGLWAEHAWGRFWGWDPKENGALLLIVWSLAVIHAKSAGWIRRLGFAYGNVILIMWLVLVWIGINRLRVGLHSYGFSDHTMTAMWAVLGFEVLFLIFSALIVRLRSRNRG